MGFRVQISADVGDTVVLSSSQMGETIKDVLISAVADLAAKAIEAKDLYAGLEDLADVLNSELGDLEIDT